MDNKTTIPLNVLPVCVTKVELTIVAPGQDSTPPPTYVKQVVENFRRDFRLSILQQMNLQANSLTQLIQLEHVP
jgi:hypothetical protein